MASPTRSPWLVRIALVALVSIALAGRFAGIRSGLPHHPEPLAVNVWQSAAKHLPPDKKFSTFAYPSTWYPYLISSILDVLPGNCYALPAPADAPLEAHLAAASEPYLRARILITLISLVMIAGTFFLARQWLDPTWSLFAAALAGTSLLLLDYAMTARVHTAVGSFSLLAVFGALYLLRRGTLASYIVAGTTAALAVTSLYSGFFALPAMFIAHWFAPVRSRAQRWIGLGLAIVIVAVSFRLAYPFLFVHRAIRGEGASLDFGDQHIPWDKFNGAGFWREPMALWSYDPVLTALAFGGVVLGVVMLVRRKRIFTLDERHAAWVAGSHPLGLFLAFGMLDRPAPRFIIPLVPAMAVLGAVATLWACRRIARVAPARERFIQAAAAVIVLALPVVACVRLVMMNARDDTPTLAARWIRENTQRSDPILVDNQLSLPMEQDPDALAQVPNWVIGQWEQYFLDWPEETAALHRIVHHSARRAFMRDKHIDGDEVRSLINSLHPRWAVMKLPFAEIALHDDTRKTVREIAGEPIARFWPDEDRTGDFGDVPDAESHALDGVLYLERNGPPIEIYRLPDSGEDR